MNHMGAARGVRRGVALMVALFLITILFVFGVTLLYFIDQDSRFGLEMQRSQQAQSMASAGIFYARSQEMIYGPNAIVNPAPGYWEYWLDEPTRTQGFRIWKDPDANRTIHALGLIRDASGKVLARRELAAPSYTPPMSASFSAANMNKVTFDVDL